VAVSNATAQKHPDHLPGNEMVQRYVQQARKVLPFLFRIFLHPLSPVAFFSKSALALLLVVTPGLAMAIPVPPLTPSISGSSTTVGGPHRPQLLHPYAGVGVARLDRTYGGGLQRHWSLTPKG
jgi:hypothetical protein